MITRQRVEHLGPRANGEPVAYARVNIGPEGSSTPPVFINVQDNRSRAYLDGYLSLDAAELLRRALNDVLGPLQEEREKEAAREEARTLARLAAPTVKR